MGFSGGVANGFLAIAVVIGRVTIIRTRLSAVRILVCY